MKNIFITGCAGYIAGIITEKLLAENYKISGIDDFRNSYPDNVNKDIKFYLGNYGNKELLNKIFTENKIDCICHLAAETTISHSMSDPYKYFENNLQNGIVLFEAMRKNKIRNIILSSTAAVYGNPEFTPINESHKLKPVNAYGESKLMIENVLKWYGISYGFKYNIFRYFNASGASNSSGEHRIDESHILPRIFNAVLNKTKFKIFGDNYFTKDGTCIRDYVHVEDIADAHIRALKNIEINDIGIYNLGSGNGLSVKEIVSLCENELNCFIDIKYEAKRAGDPAELVCTFDKANAELGWKPLCSTPENIIKSGFTWYKKIHGIP
ncbi:UDP-glucose 4-epimerase GalE [soil metagenome]